MKTRYESVGSLHVLLDTLQGKLPQPGRGVAGDMCCKKGPKAEYNIRISVVHIMSLRLPAHYFIWVDAGWRGEPLSDCFTLDGTV